MTRPIETLRKCCEHFPDCQCDIPQPAIELKARLMQGEGVAQMHERAFWRKLAESYLWMEKDRDRWKHISMSTRKLCVVERPSLISGLLRENIRVIDWLRREYPGKWAYNSKRPSLCKWFSETHEVCMFSHIADAERDMFQSHLTVYKLGEHVSIRQYPRGNPYFGD